jgi:phosphatidylethanolamine/phosphatidyl-N-methylethanolamine N-methyltransferase
MMVRKFLAHGTQIASVAPSSRSLVRVMLKGIDFARTRTLVELGAGTGPITAELVRRAQGTPCKLLIIERDRDFCQRLRERFDGRAEIIQADAGDLDRILAERGVDQVEQIVSGLPTPSLPPDVYRRIFTAVGRRLSPEGEFRQLTVIPWVYKRFYKKHFNDVRFHLVPINVPPGGVYVCKRLRERTRP